MKIYVVTKETESRRGPDCATEVICAYTTQLSATQRVNKENTDEYASSTVYDKYFYFYTATETELLDT